MRKICNIRCITLLVLAAIAGAQSPLPNPVFGVNCKGFGDPRIGYRGVMATGSPNFAITLANTRSSTPALLYLSSFRADMATLTGGCTIYPSTGLGATLSTMTNALGAACIPMPLPLAFYLPLPMYCQWMIVDPGGPVSSYVSLSDGLQVDGLVGMRMEVVKKASGTIRTIAEAIVLLDNPGPNPSAVLSYTDLVDFNDVAGIGFGSFPGGSLFSNIPILSTGLVNEIAVRLTGLITVPPGASPNMFTFAVGSDDGFRLSISDGVSIRSAEFPTPRSIAVGPLLTVTFPPAGGRFPIELVFFEGVGGAILELSYAPGAIGVFSTATFKLVNASQSLSR